MWIAWVERLLNECHALLTFLQGWEEVYVNTVEGEFRATGVVAANDKRVVVVLAHETDTS